jgi:hypothetical protein
MDRKTLYRKYARYQDVIEKLGTGKLLGMPEVSTITDNKSIIQGAYRDIRNDKLFEGGFVEYLCYLSLEYVVDNLKREMGEEKNYVKWAIKLVESYDKYKPEIRNIFRLYSYNSLFHTYFQSAIGIIEYEGKMTPEIWGGKEEIMQYCEVDALITGFIEILDYTEFFGIKPDFYDELFDYIVTKAERSI